MKPQVILIVKTSIAYFTKILFFFLCNVKTRQHLPEHGIDDGLLERVLGLFLPDHVNERDGGASLDDGGFDGLLARISNKTFFEPLRRSS